MKKIYIPLPVLFLFVLITQFSFASGPGWTAKFEPEKVFILNKGQFKINETPGFDNNVQYAYNGQDQKFYFTPSGVVLQILEIKKPKVKEEDKEKERAKNGNSISAADHAKKEQEENHLIITKDELRAQWIGANPNVQIIAEGQHSAYYSFSFKDESGKLVNENFIPGFDKITYKDLYPNIDVVYEMHGNEGIKYSVVVHPGGDISQVKLAYSKKARLLADGDVKTKSRFGDFTDHAPATFYQDSKTQVASSYILTGNVISFSVGHYDPAKTIIIDPWTQTPNFAGSGGWQCVWECQRDGASNVYVIGGVSAEDEMKYSSTGTLLWTYVTPFDTANYWLGTFAVDNPGNSYVTGGSLAAMVKVNPAGSVVWSNTSVGGIFSLTEFWDISFNCDQTQLVIGGTGGTALGGPLPYIYNMNMNTGNVLNSAQVTGGGLFLPQETRAITACGNGNYYFLTHDSIGYIHQGLTLCVSSTALPFHTYNTYNLGYKCEDFRVNNTGIKAIKSFGGYIYTHRGDQVHKRPFNTGLIIGTAAIPGGGFTTSFGASQVLNSGIDVDSCGHVFVGSVNQVVEYDINLNQLAVFPTSSNFNVYDVQVSPNGNVIAAGSTGTSSSGARTGYVETFAAAACPVIAIVCCDASICPVGSVCATASPFNLTAGTSGGVWSGTGITNASTGTFSPSVSGIGTFTVYYTLSCGSDSTTVTVNNCSALSVCRNANGSVTVSGGSAPYTWSVWDSTGQVCSGPLFLGICTGTWLPQYGWTQFGTGLTVTPPSQSDTIKVSDGGAFDSIANISALASCSSCTLTIEGIVSTPPTCGASNGTATVTVTTGTGTAPYHYLWSVGAADTFATVNGLGTGTFTVTVTDAGGCTASASVTFAPAGTITLVVDTVPAYCGQSDGKAYVTPSGGTPAYTYVWSSGGSTTDSSVHLAANTYTVTVTDANHCTATASATIRAAAGVVLSLVSEHDVTCYGDTNGTITVAAAGGVGPYSYTWSPSVSTTTSATNLRPGSYTIVATDANNCTSSLPVTVGQPGAVSVSTTTTQSNCGVSTGSATAIVSGAVGTPTYQWSAGGSPTAVTDNSLAAGSYTVTVTDGNGCTAAGAAGVSDIGAPTAVINSQTNVNCNGGNTGAIVLGVTGGTPPYTYTWSANATTTVDSAAFNLTAGIYSVTVASSGNCIAVVAANITQPQALSASLQSANSDCGVSNGWVKVTASGGTGSYTYTWSVAQTTDSITGLAGGKYYVTVTDSLGCPYIDSIIVGTNNGPVAPVITAGGPVSFCQGGSVTLTSSATTGNIWSTSATTQSITVTTAGSYTVTQTVGGCTSPPSAPIVVTINPIPPAPSITPSGPTTFCQGGSVTLTSSASSANLWSDNETTQSIVVSSAGTFTVSDTVGGCPSAPSAPLTVIVTAGPLPVIVPSQRSFCPGTSSVTLDATTAGATAYQWSTASTQPSIVITSAGFYEVTVTVSGCTGTDTITINSELPLGPLPPLDSSTICRGDTVMLNATTANATSYVWSGPGFSSTSPIVVLDSGGVYSVVVSNNCGSVIGSTTLNLIDCECRIVVPNAFTPNGDGVNDYFYPDFDCNNPISLSMRIFNRWGELVYETSDLYGQWDGTYKGTLQPAGVYVYYVEFNGMTNNTQKSYKLMGSLTLIR
jgi:gliding motility-associated-like protein